jgi:hypothetical protein
VAGVGWFGWSIRIHFCANFLAHAGSRLPHLITIGAIQFSSEAGRWQLLKEELICGSKVRGGLFADGLQAMVS